MRSSVLQNKKFIVSSTRFFKLIIHFKSCFPVGKIAEKAVFKSVFLFCFDNMALYFV